MNKNYYKKKNCLAILVFSFILFPGCLTTSLVHNARIIDSKQICVHVENPKTFDYSKNQYIDGFFYGFSIIESKKIDDFWQYSFQISPLALGLGLDLKRLLINFDFLLFSVDYFIGGHPINLTNEIRSILTLNILNRDLNLISGLGNSIGFWNWFNYDNQFISCNYVLISISFDYLIIGKSDLSMLGLDKKELSTSFYFSFDYKWFLEDIKIVENDKIWMFTLGFYFY